MGSSPMSARIPTKGDNDARRGSHVPVLQGDTNGGAVSGRGKLGMSISSLDVGRPLS